MSCIWAELAMQGRCDNAATIVVSLAHQPNALLRINVGSGKEFLANHTSMPNISILRLRHPQLHILLSVLTMPCNCRSFPYHLRKFRASCSWQQKTCWQGQLQRYRLCLTIGMGAMLRSLRMLHRTCFNPQDLHHRPDQIAKSAKC